MKARPILFSGGMVRAILTGQKTQTRRVITPQSLMDTLTRVTACYRCPYGHPLALLWVREAFSPHYFGHMKPGYSADYDVAAVGDVVPRPRWTPSIHMPLWASRITLEITNVRVERLQEISERDAKAEGVTAWHDTKDGTVYRPEFHMLWDKINAKRGYSWISNPWVWVIEFQRKI